MPPASLLFGQSHPSLHADDELGEVFRETLADDLVQPTVFVFREVSSLTLRFLPVIDFASGVRGDLFVFPSTATTQGEERSVQKRIAMLDGFSAVAEDRRLTEATEAFRKSNQILLGPMQLSFFDTSPDAMDS